MKAVMLLQAVIGALSVLLTYKIAEDTLNETVGLVAAGMLVVAPLTNLYVGINRDRNLLHLLGCARMLFVAERASHSCRDQLDRSQYLHFRAHLLPVYLQWVSVLVHLFVLCLTVVGMWQNRNRFGQLLPLYLFPIALVLGHSILWCDSRYLLPALPMLLVFAASRWPSAAANRVDCVNTNFRAVSCIK